MRICVLGGGIIGVSTAFYLARDGHEVVVLDAREGVGLETSYANGGQLSYNYVAPLADPSVFKKLPAWLLNASSPLRYVPRFEMQQWLWCLSFLLACRADTARMVTASLLALGKYSQVLMRELLASETIAFDYANTGKLVVYRDRSDFEKAKRQKDLQARLGSVQEALDPIGCLEREPALDSIMRELVGGIFTADEAAGDCYKLTLELSRLAADNYGVQFEYRFPVRSLRASGGKIVAACADRADVEADAFVVAAGTGSRALLLPLGLSLPIYPLTGYSLTIPLGDERHAPKVSVTDAHHKVVYASIGDRLRVAGMADITGAKPSATGDGERLGLLMRRAREAFPQAGDFDRAEHWCGHRPATPLSKPILGATPYQNLWLNTGHGALGFTLACACARLVADQIAGTSSPLGIADFELSSSRRAFAR